MIVLEGNAILKLIVDDDGQLLANAAGNSLPVDKPYRHIIGINIHGT